MAPDADISPTATATLVLPSNLPESLAYRAMAAAAGARLIGASALTDDPFADFYEAWAYLPLVGDAGFEPALASLLRERRIGAVFTPHVVVRQHLETALGRVAPGVSLIGPLPEAGRRAATTDFARRAALGGRLCPPGPAPAARPPLDMLERMALLKQAHQIEGQCSDEKIWLLCELARTAPPGDIVEIGSAWGRSAFALAWLARRYELGAVLCVDPWTRADTHQEEAGETVRELVAGMDIDRMFTEFRINLMGLFPGRLNYLRLPSARAVDRYRAVPKVATREFGSTAYRGAISILHVDGNHDLAAVTQDLATWPEAVRPGGWVLVDDYCWPFADGPRRAGDAFLDRHRDAIDRAFVQDGVLCIQLGGPVAGAASPASSNSDGGTR